MTSEQIGFVLTVVLVVLLMWVRDRLRRAGERKLQKPFLEKYEPFVREHGELFEKLTIPMDEDDRSNVKNYYNFFFGFCSVFTALLLVILIYNAPDSTIEYFQMAGFIGVLVVVFVMVYMQEKRRLLKCEDNY